MRLAIHQPEYWPCLALLRKLALADLTVLLDTVQFRRDGLQHRARLARRDGCVQWLTIPYEHTGAPQSIRDVKIADEGWPRRHLKTLQALYGRAPGFDRRALETFFAGAAHCELVSEASAASMELLAQAFGVKLTTVRAAAMPSIAAGLRKGELVLEICRRWEAECYVSGAFGATYLDREAFARAGVAIEVVAAPAEPPAYRKGLGAAGWALSGLDAWMHLGGKAPSALCLGPPPAPAVVDAGTLAPPSAVEALR